MTTTDVFDHDEVKAILGAINLDGPCGFRNYALFQLMVQTGIRIGEALQVKPGDIAQETWGTNGDRVTVWVLRMPKHITKGKKDRVGIPLTRETMAAVDRWTKCRDELGIKGGPLFCTISSGERKAHFAADAALVPGEPLYRQYCSDVLKRLARKAGIEGRVHLHMLRHTSLTNLYDKTRDLRLVQTVAGHASSRTTERYTHVHPIAIAEAMQAI